MTTTTHTYCAELLHHMVDETRPKGENGWGSRHVSAFNMPRSDREESISLMLRGIAMYCDDHYTRFASPVGEDGYVGVYVAEPVLRALRAMLNTDLDRFDGGTLDGLLLDMAKSQGIDLE